MKERPNLNELAKEIHEDNKAKGFHDEDWSNEHCLCLVISELMEAVEADRKGKRTKWDAYNQDLNWFCNWSRDSVCYKEKEIHAFAVYIKDTIEDELADFVIRLLDLAGLRGYDVGRFLLKIPVMSKSFTENIFKITTEIAYYKWSMEERVNFAILNVEELCNTLSIDLWLHVDLKLKYNKTRPYKHGKEY